jgi:hypothetical protein
MEESQLIINSPLTANDRRRTDRQVIIRLRAPEQIIAYFHRSRRHGSGYPSKRRRAYLVDGAGRIRTRLTAAHDGDEQGCCRGSVAVG